MTTILELKARCKNLGLKNYCKLNKKKLEELLEKYEHGKVQQKHQPKKYLVKDLLKICKEKKIKGCSNKNKKELEKLIFGNSQQLQKPQFIFPIPKAGVFKQQKQQQQQQKQQQKQQQQKQQKQQRKQQKPQFIFPIPKVGVFEQQKKKLQRKEEPKKKLSRCPNGYRRNKKTGECERNIITKQNFQRNVQQLNWLSPVTRKNSLGLNLVDLLPSVYLYRVTNHEKLKSNRATYFTVWYGTLNAYIENEKYFQIYTKKENRTLNLLDLGDVETINKLLRMTFYGYPNMQTYTMVSKFFISPDVERLNGDNFRNHPYSKYFSSFETPTQPWQLNVPMRSSYYESDFEFANFLCAHNYDGYVAQNVLDSRYGFMYNFHGEVMLCNPINDLELVKSMKVSKKFQKLKNMQKAMLPYVNSQK